MTRNVFRVSFDVRTKLNLIIIQLRCIFIIIVLLLAFPQEQKMMYNVQIIHFRQTKFNKNVIYSMCCFSRGAAPLGKI